MADSTTLSEELVAAEACMGSSMDQVVPLGTVSCSINKSRILELVCDFSISLSQIRDPCTHHKTKYYTGSILSPIKKKAKLR